MSRGKIRYTGEKQRPEAGVMQTLVLVILFFSAAFVAAAFAGLHDYHGGYGI